MVWLFIGGGSCWEGALAGKGHFLEMGFGDMSGLGDAGFFVVENWF